MEEKLKWFGKKKKKKCTLSKIVLGINDTSTLVGHFVLSTGEREKRNSRDKREGQGRKRNRNEREETEEIKTCPSTLTCYKDSKSCPTVSQYQLDAPSDVRYTTPLPHTLSKALVDVRYRHWPGCRDFVCLC